MQTSLLLIVSLGTVVIWALQRVRSHATRLPYPPGPKGLPIVGNLRDLRPKTLGSQSNYRWERYLEWSRQYNSPDIVSAHAFGGRFIILNSKKAVEELLDKRSRNHSDRPGGSPSDYSHTLVAEFPQVDMTRMLYMSGFVVMSVLNSCA